MPPGHTDTSYTYNVKTLVSLFHDQKQHANTIIADAVHFFTTHSDNKKHKVELSKELSQTRNDKQVATIKEKIRQFELKLENERHDRIERLHSFIHKILALTEAETDSDTHIASGKFLGTLLLTTDSHQADLANYHQLLKPLYKVILTLRLTDDVLSRGQVKHNYLGKYIDSLSRFRGNLHWQERWVKEVALPLAKAALLQDIGLYHPACQVILNGPDNEKDPFRLLEEKERKMLLKMSLQYSLAYLKYGLGIQSVPADTQQERDQALYIQQQALAFTLETVQDATILKNHIGDLIKIPQIYASFVLSTKSDYDKKDVPKGYMVIEQLMKKGVLQNRIALCFLKMVGYFPQGFGITYIALDEQGNQKCGYEFAIVNKLYPSQPACPRVRTVSRNLNFITAGKDVAISRNHNLYFQNNHKKIQRVETQRLNEIMTQLSGGQGAKNAEDLIPQWWEPFDFFSDKKNQNLWTGKR